MHYLSLFYSSMQLKALSALSTLFGQKPGEEVVQIVPQWVFLFSIPLLHFHPDLILSWPLSE
jgi:hypothetical protein